MTSVEEIKITNLGNYRWIQNDVFQLIELVKENPAIYNPQDKNYFCRPFVENIWREIDIKLKKNPGCSLAKWTNLRICFRREYSNFMSDNVKPSWTFFENMFFLHPFLRKKRLNPERLENHIQEALEQISSITRGNIRNYVKHIENIETCDEPTTESFTGARGGSRSAESEDDDCILDENFMIKDEPHENNSHIGSYNDDLDDVVDDDDDDELDSTLLKSKTNTSHKTDLRITPSPNDGNVIEIRKRNLKRKRKTPEKFISDINYQEFTTNTGKFDNKYINEDDENFRKIQNDTIDCLNRKNNEEIDIKKNEKHHEYFSVPIEIKPLKQSISATTISNKSTTYKSNEQNIQNEKIVKLCDCKTDSDAMFLMSLLPDIQSLSRRDKGKFKIEVQKLVQDLLYPNTN